VEHDEPDPLRTRFPRVLVTGAGGQLGTALAESFPWANGYAHAQWDITTGTDESIGPLELILHAAAWTDVDGAEADEKAARTVNVSGTKRVMQLNAPVVYYSTDYVFDGRKREPYVESDSPDPQSVYGRSKLDGEQEIGQGWIVRTSWLFGWTGHNFVRTMFELGREREEVRVVDDQRGCPTYVGHLAEATRSIVELPFGLYHVAAAGDCTWADFAEAIFEEANLSCRVVRISTGELGRPAPRPANSVLRSENSETPFLPHWREGLRECLVRIRDL
jgi:dTDP-4-dehydrorhamnose reductase